MRSQLNELRGSQCNNKYDNGMQHFLFPPSELPAVCPLSQHESALRVSSRSPPLFILIYSRFCAEIRVFSLGRAVIKGRSREEGREKEGLNRHEQGERERERRTTRRRSRQLRDADDGRADSSILTRLSFRLIERTGRERGGTEKDGTPSHMLRRRLVVNDGHHEEI